MKKFLALAAFAACPILSHAFIAANVEDVLCVVDSSSPIEVELDKAAAYTSAFLPGTYKTYVALNPQTGILSIHASDGDDDMVAPASGPLSPVPVVIRYDLSLLQMGQTGEQIVACWRPGAK